MKHIFAAVLGAVVALTSVNGLVAVAKKPAKKNERVRAKNSRHHDSCSSSSSSSSSSSGCCGCDCSSF